MHKQSKLALYMYCVCKTLHLCGICNFWFEKNNYNRTLSNIYAKVNNFLTLLIFLFILAEYGAFYTQRNLSEKRFFDMIILSSAHPFFFYYNFSLIYHKNAIKKLIHTLVFELKRIYNDVEVEENMIIRIKWYSYAYWTNLCSTMLFYGFGALIKVINNGETFTTIILCWPDIEERSIAANVSRIFFYLLWCYFVLRTGAIYIITLMVTLCVGYQYKNLCSYFHSLNEIFEEPLTQDEKETKYLTSFADGVKMHRRTLWCTKQIQNVFLVMRNGQMLLCVIPLAIVMYHYQMMGQGKERSMVGTVTIVLTAGTIMFSTGCFMWSAGDITVEASYLPVAMYCSGWHNCYKRTREVRKLLSIAMAHGQIPVVISAFGVIEMSYTSFVKIVKASYSIFSIFY